MSDDRDSTALVDIANACQLVLDFLKDRGKPEFDADLMLQSPVLHQLLVLGEAVRRLTIKFRTAHSTIDWRGFAGLRNVLIHQYDTVDLDEVWRIATGELPELRRQIDPWLPDEAR